MAKLWCFVIALLLGLCACCLAAPSADDLDKFGQLERTLKELTTSILAMSGADAGEEAVAESNSIDLWNSGGGTFPDLSEFQF